MLILDAESRQKMGRSRFLADPAAGTIIDSFAIKPRLESEADFRNYRQRNIYNFEATSRILAHRTLKTLCYFSGLISILFNDNSIMYFDKKLQIIQKVRDVLLSGAIGYSLYTSVPKRRQGVLILQSMKNCKALDGLRINNFVPRPGGTFY